MTSKKGVTLLELIMVIAIIGIMSSVTFVSLSGDKNREAVRGAAREVAGVLREAQNLSLTGKTKKSGEYPCSFSFIPSESAYKIDYNYHIDNETECKKNKEYAKFFLNNGVTFDGGDGNRNVVNFSVPFGRVSGEAKYTLKKSGAKFSVCVCGSGKIEEKEGDNCDGVC